MKTKHKLCLMIIAFLIGVYAHLFTIAQDGSWKCTVFNARPTISDVVTCNGIEAFGVDMASLPEELK